MAQKKQEASKPSLKKTIWLSIAAGFFLLITNTAIWVNNQIFDADNFTSTVTTSLTSESSRNAISQEITDRMFADRPIAKRIAGDFSVKLIGGLLDTDQFRNVLTPAVEKMQVYVTSSNQESVVVELGGVKDIITKITNVSESFGRDATVNPENIPNEIIIVNEKDVPDLYKIGVAFLWLAPLSLLAALILLAYPYIKHLNDKRKILITQGSIITVIGLLALMVGPLFKPPVLAVAKGPNGREVIGNLYNSFIASFNSQTIILTLLGVLIVLIGTAWVGYPYVKGMVQSRKSTKTTPKKSS